MGEWFEAMEDGVICPHCFPVLVENGENSGFSLISCDCGGASETKARPFSNEERKQAREAATRDADRCLERKRQNDWEADRARILRAHRDAS
ncbi:hypothetical protein JKG68_24675 [Microvirga aerilata]|jgi:hypothetical protein|uniref:Uncharacterized protein n=1 Tax=Microvirga aerilata TaxID=670292 RepID=A0A937D2R2_9HYPH|nr:hypothetical protein [Microvirga aerilata]MBL0407132.1 hypothetical protein [Microvirga aerilata]